jgi:hypothetical protein
METSDKKSGIIKTRRLKGAFPFVKGTCRRLLNGIYINVKMFVMSTPILNSFALK